MEMDLICFRDWEILTKVYNSSYRRKCNKLIKLISSWANWKEMLKIIIITKRNKKKSKIITMIINLKMILFKVCIYEE